jgi:NADP-dependent 3-hydroxy acid dehydrogenase YdfG
VGDEKRFAGAALSRRPGLQAFFITLLGSEAMDLGLQGKRALVTGSTAGIGWATARALAAEGAEVTLNGRTEDRVRAAVESLRRETPGARAHGVAADLSTADGCAALIAKRPEVDVLVNSMGIFEPKPFAEITDADWLRFFETNVLSGVRLARHYVGGMRSRDWGRIVFVSSESALQIPTEMIHYGVTKTAQLAVARGLAETLQGTGGHRQQRPARSYRFGGGRGLRGPARGGPRHGRCGRGARFLRHRASELDHPPLCHARRGRGHDRVRVQRAGLGGHGGGLARRRRGRARDIRVMKNARTLPATGGRRQGWCFSSPI